MISIYETIYIPKSDNAAKDNPLCALLSSKLFYILNFVKISYPAYDMRISPIVLESLEEIIKGNPPLSSSYKDFIFFKILSSFLNPILSFFRRNYFKTTNLL